MKSPFTLKNLFLNVPANFFKNLNCNPETVTKISIRFLHFQFWLSTKISDEWTLVGVLSRHESILWVFCPTAPQQSNNFQIPEQKPQSVVFANFCGFASLFVG
jgi:hypothetical protein